MVEATKEFFTKYACFKGRTSRANYWWTILGIFLLTIVILVIAQLIFGAPPVLEENAEPEEIVKALSNGYVIVSLIWDLLLVIPSIAICVRRLHDTNKSGWWYLLNFVPFGSIVLLVFYLSPAVNEGNQY